MRPLTGRDPLGMQPVWSGLGRLLVPNLAGPVTQINGISAVLLIHYLSNGPLKLFLDAEKHSFRSYFRLMEGLLETYLWDSSRHCFGTQTFNSGTIFSLKTNDTRTVANGLYQYYRGTCGRANLLSDEWNVSDEVTQALSACWSEDATIELKGALSAPLKKNGALIPIEVLDNSPALKTALSAVFDSIILLPILNDRLFGSPVQRAFASYCAELASNHEQDADKIRVGHILSLVTSLDVRLREANDPAFDLLSALDNIQKCEPFLTTVQDCFDYVRSSPDLRISDLVLELNDQKELIKKRAATFLELEGLAALPNSPRMREMLQLARAATLGLTDFLSSIIQHHVKAMDNRGRDPYVVLECEKIMITIPSERDKEGILNRLVAGYPWDNGYYLHTAGNIFAQAKEAING
jgi:hypothetical protein